MSEEKREKLRKTMEELRNLVAKGEVSPQAILDAVAMAECVHMNWAVRRAADSWYVPTELGKAMAGREGS